MLHNNSNTAWLPHDATLMSLADPTSGGSGGSNADLIWNLETFTQRRLAHEFVLKFENRLCVCSGSVQQLYANYNIFMPANESSRLIILPNPMAHYDVFNNLPDTAIRATGLTIVPDARGDLMLRIPTRSGAQPYRLIPLQTGFQLINQRRPPNSPLLPVLVKGDLRELNALTPCLHLHALSLRNVPQLSRFELAAIKQTVVEKLAQLGTT